MIPEVSVVALEILFAVLVVWYYFQTKDRLEKLDKKVKGIDAKLSLMPQESTLQSEMDEVRRQLENLRSLLAGLSQPKAVHKATRPYGLQAPELSIVAADPVETARKAGRSRAEVELLMRLHKLNTDELPGGGL